MIARRSAFVVCEKVSKARRAAATALSTSAADPIAISAKLSSVEGSTTGRVAGVSGSTQRPSM